MSRIVSFGCSLTFGQSLPDCILGKKTDLPSQYAWPSVLARLMRRPCKNYGIPGASNLEILHCISSVTEIFPGDVVIVMWSFLERSCVLESDTVKQIGPWIDRPEIKTYYQHLHSDYTDRFLYPILVRHGDALVRKHTDNVYHMEARTTDCFPLSTLGVSIDDAEPFTDATYTDTGIDGVHPGIIRHEQLAKKIYAILQAN